MAEVTQRIAGCEFTLRTPSGVVNRLSLLAQQHLLIETEYGQVNGRRRMVKCSDYEALGFCRIAAHVVGITGKNVAWEPLSELDFRNGERVFLSHLSYLEMEDAHPEIASGLARAVADLYKPQDEDLAPEPLPDDAEKKDASAGAPSKKTSKDTPAP